MPSDPELETRGRLIRSLGALREMLPGSFVERKRRCGRPNCHCADGSNLHSQFQISVLVQGKPKTFNIKVASVVWATGWNPYDPTKMTNLSFGKVQNVITNMMMERLAAVNGPTNGKIIRPSDGKAVNNIAFVQCAGSRDENHLPFCSYICCLASLKQTTYIREANPESKATIYYIDLRTPGRYEKFYKKVKADGNVSFLKGKVAKIEEDPATKDVIVTVEDTLSGKKIQARHEMVVLATGMEPSTAQVKVPGNAKYDDNSFVISDEILATGCVKKPSDVMSSGQTATGTALKAIQMVRR